MKKINNKLLLTSLVVIIFLVGGFVLAQVLFPPPPTTPQDNPPVEYNSEEVIKMTKILDERPELSTGDKEVRDTLIASPKRITEASGEFSIPLNRTDDYSIEYLSAPDQFLVEILTINIEKAKEDTVTWFTQQGLTHEGICHLPVVFYLNGEVAENLRGESIEFNPLPSGC